MVYTVWFMDTGTLLIPFGMLYGLGVGVRNSLYERSWLRTHHLGARTVSIGNITTGGTGKTPLVAAVAEMLADSGEDVCILTRGYGRENAKRRVLVSDRNALLADAATGGDEPVELARRLIGKAYVLADPDRVAAARWAKDAFGITAFVLDDGFQHRRARRDLDIVCIDTTDPFGGERLLPAGRLREPLRGLRRADVFVITRTELSPDTESIAARLREYNPAAPIFFASATITRMADLGTYLSAAGPAAPELPPSAATGSDAVRFVAFCGLAKPENFFAGLRLRGCNIVETVTFPDHHR
ncbi:MAG TPA: tetraacyldisaccharide 4'-kinase, partial [Pyrinomonadaceae bacterium]|nr:tetraacyldisaccharide 4'-kinase [Pyrinomonadaceae bacterium]